MRITTYADLKRYAKGYADRNFTLMIIRGRGGIGKSYIIEDTIREEQPIIFKGHATPLSIYMTCVKNPKSLVLFDDVDSLMNNKTNVALLKQLCDTKQEKTVYYSSSAKYDGENIPPSFVSRNKVMLLCNSDIRDNADINAVMTRGFYIHFDPDNDEVMRQLCSFAEDKDLVKHLQKELYRIPGFNFRIYEKCLQLKDAEIPYEDYLVEEYGFLGDSEVLKAIINLPIAERNREWKLRTGKSVRSLLRVLKSCKAENLVGRPKK